MHLPTKQKTKPMRASWGLDDIAFDAIDTAQVRDDEFLFLTLASASYVEIFAKTYSDTLIEFFRANRDTTDWLHERWQQDEVQHGRALQRYVQTVWPEFDWQRGYDAFRTQYSCLCAVEQLASRLALELVALNEPVLYQLIGNIKADEAGHYRHFRQFFATYSAVDPQSVWAVIATTWRRVRDVRGQDVFIAFKHGRMPSLFSLCNSLQ